MFFSFFEDSASKLTSYASKQRVSGAEVQKLINVALNFVGVNVQDCGDLKVFVTEDNINGTSKLKNANACGLNAKMVTLYFEFIPLPFPLIV